MIQYNSTIQHIISEKVRNYEMESNKDGLKLVVTGNVKNNYYDEDLKKRTLSLCLSPENIDALEDTLVKVGFEWSGDRYPIKQDRDGEDYLKTTSLFKIQVEGLPDGYVVDEIGVGTKVDAYITLKEGVYKRQKYVSAYLVGLNILDFKEKEDVSCFDDTGFKKLGEDASPASESQVPFESE